MMQRLALAIVTLLAFVMLTFAAETHGVGMAMADQHHDTASQIQTHEAHKVAALQCLEQGKCGDAGALCDFVCAGLTSFVPAEGEGFVRLDPLARLATIASENLPRGISPALNDRPPILLFA